MIKVELTKDEIKQFIADLTNLVGQKEASIQNMREELNHLQQRLQKFKVLLDNDDSPSDSNSRSTEEQRVRESKISNQKISIPKLGYEVIRSSNVAMTAREILDEIYSRFPDLQENDRNNMVYLSASFANKAKKGKDLRRFKGESGSYKYEKT